MEFLEEEFDEILNIFQTESEEIISRLNNSLMQLEKKPNDKDAILMLFRDAHSLKGASRLIGFNNVQTLAHKIEDILGLAKENKIQFNPQIVDILYKTVDFMSDLIQKSIAKKQEIYSDEIKNKLTLLENIKDYTGSSEEEPQTDFDVSLLTKEIKDINSLIAECLFNLMETETGQNEASPDNLMQNIRRLYEIFKSIGYFDIKNWLEDVLMKLEFVKKASNNLTINEVEEIQQVFENIITSLVSICNLYDIETIDYYSLAFEKMNQLNPAPLREEHEQTYEEPVEFIPGFEKESESESSEFQTQEFEQIQEEPVVCFSNDFGCVREKLETLSQNYGDIVDIKEFLVNFEANCDKENVKKVIQAILKLLGYSQDNQTQLDEDAISAIIQSIDYCSEILTNNDENADVELIIQRLEIIMQLLEINSDNIKESLPATGKSRQTADLSNVFDSGEIKTLRVDSGKLDVLANQIGELMVTKIKTQKHLHELKNISTDLEEWQRNSQKVIGYLKYYEKKYFNQTSINDNSALYFIKQFLNLYGENNKNFAKTISNISSLSRNIQEDNMKTNLIVDDLEHMVKNIRVLPFATVFHIFGRMVRDIAQEKNKRIELEITGSETSTDKKIIEEIKTPLIHIIRNSIDHGIETPEERTALGKNPVGKISLRARALENKVIIEIEDDGKGINIEKIKSKALQNGYLTSEEMASMTDEQITNLIFTPGFSTGEEITNISGRGIGLDVVQTKIAQLNGRVRVISEINKGCCVQIELPTTMSTLKAFLVQASRQIFAVPMNVINTVVWKNSDEIFYSQENRTIVFNEKNIPLYDLSDVLKLPKIQTQPEGRETVLILEGEGKIVGLCVDKLIGDQEILHKKLSAPLYKIKNISGVTTLVSGEICLILNMTNIIKTIGMTVPAKIETRVQPALTMNNSDYKILLVDDSITTRTLEKNILTKADYNIETATNPLEAFEKMKFNRFDLIISDIEMPEMDGFEFLSKLKTDEMYFEIPVIMVSSLASDENKKRAQELGAFSYIVKGEFNQEEFLKLIQNALKGKN